MHGTILSFYVEPDGQHVVMTVDDPGENTTHTVRASKPDLAAMADAEPRYDPGPPQTPTPRNTGETR